MAVMLGFVWVHSESPERGGYELHNTCQLTTTPSTGRVSVQYLKQEGSA